MVNTCATNDKFPSGILLAIEHGLGDPEPQRVGKPARGGAPFMTAKLVNTTRISPWFMVCMILFISYNY